MRRLWVNGIRCSLYRALTLASLIQAQSALKKGGCPAESDAKSFAEFFRVPTSSGARTGVTVRRHYERVLRETNEEEDSLVVRLQEQVGRRGEELPVFLVSYDLKAKTFHIFSVACDRTVVVAPLGTTSKTSKPRNSSVVSSSGGGGGSKNNIKTNSSSAEPLSLMGSSTLADELMQHTRGVTRVVLLPICAHEEERAVLASYLAQLGAELRRFGLLPALHVDNMALAEALDHNPLPMVEVVANYAVVTPRPLSEAWFRAHWVYLRTLACRASEEDPTQTLNQLIVPRAEVFVIHLVRAGSHGLNVVLWDPVFRRRYAAKGMMSDVLACLLERQSKHVIFLPTNRTDRPALVRCRTALLKAGRKCQLVFASELGEQYRSVFQSEPSRYWNSLREASGALDADLLFEVCLAAGNSQRAYQKERLCCTAEAGGKGERSHFSSRPEAAAATAVAVTGAEVEKWLSVLSIDRRVARERAQQRLYKHYLLITYIATAFASHTRPANPHVSANYILAACLSDSQGHVLEPWTKYTARGHFQLPSLDDFDVLVAHDAKQLLLLVWNDTALQRFLKRGGRVWCTMLAEYIIDAQRCHTGSNAFNEVTLKYGIMVPPASALGVVAADLPYVFLRRHLVAAVEGLSAVFREQLRRAVERRQALCIAHRMDSLLCMAAMEHAGIQVDTREATQQAQAVRNRIHTIDKALTLYVPREVPLDLHKFFDWSSLQHLTAYFFGGHLALGYTDAAQDSRAWTANLVEFCHRHGNLSELSSDVHVQRFAKNVGISSAGTPGRLPKRVAQYLDSGKGPSRRFRLVVFDIESTGLNTATDEIVEIAAWDPLEDASFSSLVNPKRPIPQKTTAIHHITDDMVKSAPSLSQVAQAFARYLRVDDSGSSDEVVVLIGHNVFALDEPLLRRALRMEGADLDRVLFCDSVVMLKTLKRELQEVTSGGGDRLDRRVLDTLANSLRLSSLVEGLHVEAGGDLHRAETDSKTLWFVLVNALGLVGRSTAKQCEAVFRHAARTLVVIPGIGCFLPADQRRNCAAVRVTGVAHAALRRPSQVAALQRRALNESTLQALHRHGVEAAGLLLQREQLERHAGRFLHAGVDGRLSVLHDDDRVRQYIDMCATTTSRTTSSFPSCQNIPKDDKSLLRRLFVSRFGAQGRCVELDYSQLEIAIMALLCGDKALSTDLNRGVDFHVKRAEFFSGLPYKEIYDGYKRGLPKYVRLRKMAKTFSFQRLYGAGVPLLHKTTGIPVEDLEASIRREEKEYPGISRFHRLVRTVALRENNPGHPTHFVFELPTGLRMSFKTRDVVLNLPPVKNYPIQGFGAEVAQMMVGRVFRQFVQRDFYDGKAFIINFVHDSLWLDCHLDVLEECVRETRACLSSAQSYVEKAFPGVEMSVPLSVTVQCGVDMCSMKTVDNDFTAIKSQKRMKSSVELPDVSCAEDEPPESIEITL